MNNTTIDELRKIAREVEDEINKTTIVVGDLVAYKPGRGLLRAGCVQYEVAVVASLKPFVLVSIQGDMRWSATISLEDFEKRGKANRSTLLKVLDRFKRELFPIE